MNKDEMTLIMKIVERADEEGLMNFDRISLMLDIETAHKEIGLRLSDLLNADEFNFAHDIVGIQANIDRRSKTITNCFLPRYAKAEA